MGHVYLLKHVPNLLYQYAHLHMDRICHKYDFTLFFYYQPFH